MGGGRGGRGKPAGPDVSPSAGVRTASLTCGHETCRNVCIFQTRTLCQTSKAAAGAGGALTDTNTINAHALLPALGKQKASSTPLENEKKIQHASRHCQNFARARLTALQAAAPLAATLPVPLASLSLALPAWVSQQHLAVVRHWCGQSRP